MSCIFLTGASGVLGVEVATRLARQGNSVVALMHDKPTLQSNDGSILTIHQGLDSIAPGRISAIRGDITAPNLGMTTADAHRLSACVDLIVHAAAIIDFNRPREVYQSVNLGGTQQVIAFAKAGRRGPIPLVYVSTAYVCGERHGPIAEHELDVGQRFGNHYEESKFQAEVAVRRQAAAGLPVAIARPSIVVGDSQTGQIREFKHLYVVLRLVTEGKLRALPASYDATLDLVPVDYVAEGVVGMVERLEECAGRTLHLVSGVPTTVRHFSDILAEYPSMCVPRFIPPSSFALESLPPRERRLYRHAAQMFESYLRRRIRFVDTSARQVLGDRLPPTPESADLLRLLIDYCESAEYLTGMCIEETKADRPIASGQR